MKLVVTKTFPSSRDAAQCAPLDTHAKIRAYVSTFPTIARIDLTEIEIEGRVDFAYERGQCDLVAGGMSDQGSHFTLWRKQTDGSWKIYRDMWHSDRPL
jgi:ketosteroid isomerase-like protein